MDGAVPMSMNAIARVKKPLIARLAFICSAILERFSGKVNEN
jgi:hypothetical protein